MEFDLNGNGDIGEKRVIWGECADLGRGRSFLQCSIPNGLGESPAPRIGGRGVGIWKWAGVERERVLLSSPPSSASRYHVPEANAGETWGPQDPPGAKEINPGGIQWLWGDFQLL